MAAEMNENVCYNVPGTIMKGVDKKNTEYENSDNKILSKENSSSLLKSNQETSNSSFTFTMKTCLTVTFLIIVLMQVTLCSVIVVLYLKVSTLEAHESTLSATQINKTLLNNLISLQLEFRELGQQNKQNFLFLESQFNHEIASLNSSVLVAENILKRILHPIVGYNQTCAEIGKLSNGYSSGDYILKLSAEAIRTVYCDMTRTFGGSTSGWMRLSKLDVNNCPQGFKTTVHSGAFYTCVRSESRAGCTEIRFSTHNISYSNISGAVRALNAGSWGGFKNVGRSKNVNVSSYYLDGVSVSCNNQHIWSFAVGCECGDFNNPNKPRFVGNDYMCDHVSFLWEPQQCNSNSTWFFKMLPPTTDDITVRVCRDQSIDFEDIALTALELYIQ